jgi:hypothetical protein
LVAEACARIGLPKPQRVVLAAHSALRGAPSVRPGQHAPAWTGWRLPPSLASRRLTHAVLDFAEQVAGPVLLGAGRFTGLGLCLPLGSVRGGGGKSRFGVGVRLRWPSDLAARVELRTATPDRPRTR